MKILYIGHYREGGGWSNAALDYIQALDSIGLDVVCRNISLTGTQAPVPNRILELENKSLQGVDYCIQNVLPHHLVGTTKFKKNVAICYYETNSLQYNIWTENLRLMDEVWVANKSTHDALDGTNLDKIRIVHNPCNIDKYKNEYKKINIPNANHKFKFYFIGDMNDRKNLESVIKCFHSEFCNKEPVCLVVKINKFGVSPEALSQTFNATSSNIKQVLRLSKKPSDYCQEAVISANLSEQDMYNLHNTCDCFINISHGEGWSIPSFDAMAFGNTPICSKEGGPEEFIDREDHNTGSLIDGVYNVCTHRDPAFSHIFTGREEWFVPNEAQAKAVMRYYYENKNNMNREVGLERAKKFSYENIANQIKEHLSE